MASATKRFYSILDTSFIGELPQASQHILIASMAELAGGKVTFYTMEDHYTLATHEVILAKLAEKPDIEGLIFFRVQQFCQPGHDGRSQFDILAQILKRGFEVHFARERLSLRSAEDLERNFASLFVSQHVRERDKAHSHFNGLLGRRG